MEYLHSDSFQKLKQRFGSVFRAIIIVIRLFALLQSVALVDQRLDFTEFERAYSITAFHHSFPDAAGVHRGHQYYVSYL